MIHDFHTFLGYPTVQKIDDLTLTDASVLALQRREGNMYSSVECDFESVETDNPSIVDKSPITLSVLPWALVQDQLSKDTTIFWVELHGLYYYLEVTSWEVKNSHIHVEAEKEDSDFNFQRIINAEIVLGSIGHIRTANVSISENSNFGRYDDESSIYFYSSY